MAGETVLRLPPEMRTQLRERAATEEREQSRIIRRALTHYFENTDEEGRWLCEHPSQERTNR